MLIGLARWTEKLAENLLNNLVRLSAEQSAKVVQLRASRRLALTGRREG